MNLVFALIIAFSSPIWPLGENPLPGDPYLIVNKQTNSYLFVDEGNIVKEGRVATGKSTELTPEGEFTIVVKAKDPYYRKKDIRGGDPDNPLGSRWIGFDAKNTDGRIYGLHGNNNPETIGKYVTAGCVRFKEDDIQWLYDHVPLGTKIVVVNTSKSLLEIAQMRNVIVEYDE
ncbi:L,D-transpeptidase [Alkalihalobacillus sp. AL-G]|uniref:L,D-transpeptidase n=1 Tax=Alkalihalobacillus sp. AL-G TaxID=2926399 RepID=UPI00272C2B51|nr:L,D-transpeptidase [Alkalihalobacillus sp. AL-G]WLD95416.1 L,D-transpeptidase [Alkalihalobacillus sp. AL-G]